MLNLFLTNWQVGLGERDTLGDPQTEAAAAAAEDEETVAEERQQRTEQALEDMARAGEQFPKQRKGGKETEQQE